VFDAEEGLEKIWLIWSEHSVAELETLIKLANPNDAGLFNDPSRASVVAWYLKTLAATDTQVEKGGTGWRMKLKGNGEVLAGVGTLKHQ